MNTNEIKLTMLEHQVIKRANAGTGAWSIARELSAPGVKISAPRVRQIQDIIDAAIKLGLITEEKN